MLVEHMDAYPAHIGTASFSKGLPPGRMASVADTDPIHRAKHDGLFARREKDDSPGARGSVMDSATGTPPPHKGVPSGGVASA